MFAGRVSRGGDVQKTLYIVSVCIGVVFAVIGIGLYFVYALNPILYGFSRSIDILPAANFGQFIGGFVGTTVSIVVSFLLFATLLNQSITNARVAIESNFYKMLDYHFQHIQSLAVKHVRASQSDYESVTGKRAFIVFKLHLERLLRIVSDVSKSLEVNLTDDQVIDIACIAFYYGLDDQWRDFLEDKLRRYPNHQQIVELLIQSRNAKLERDGENVGRANQTSLSSYFRNMYHLIKYVDTQKLLTSREKITYMNILRAQLSNAELWLLYFNVVSRFGRKWLENDYVVKYRLIKNMPHGFCKPFDHTTKFPMQYEEDELDRPEE
jgi:hypothetical protein